MSRIDELNSQKNEYSLLIEALDSISLLPKDQFDVVRATIAKCEKKKGNIEREIEKYLQYQKTIVKRYGVLRFLLIVFSAFAIIFLFLAQRTATDTLSLFALFFLAVQYGVLLFLDLRTRKRLVYILSMLLILVPFGLLAIKQFFPDILQDTEWFAYTLQGISLYNFFVGFYDRMSTSR
jgi:hypothetical protein